LTFLIFILYIYAMQEWWLNRPGVRRENSDSGDQKGVLDNTMFYSVFWLIHFLILIFTILLHTLPGTLVYKDLGWPLYYPKYFFWYFVGATVLLAIVNIVFLQLLRLVAPRRNRTEIIIPGHIVIPDRSYDLDTVVKR